MEAYRANIAASDESALEGSPVFEVMEKRIDASWEGTATDLLTMLEEHDGACDLARQHDDRCDLITTFGKKCTCGKTNTCTCGMTRVKQDHAWPKNSRSLSSAIRRLIPNAERLGWKFVFGRSGSNRDRTIRIEKGSDDIPF